MTDIDGSGAGAFDAGEGDAGWEVLTPGVARSKTLVPAPKFDPLTRRYLIGDGGALIEEHPVLARARHLLGIRRRGIASAPTVGIPLARLRAARQDQVQREVEDAVRIALAPLVDAGDLEIVRVQIELPFRGRFYTDLRNLRAPNTKPVRIATNLQD